MLKLYENIKAHRLSAKMSQSELARRTGYKDRSAIAKIETGHIDLPQSKIQQFADVFGVTPGQLMGWDEETPTASMAAGVPIIGGDTTMGDVIKTLRTENHLTMEEFAAELGIPLEEMQQYENGSRQLPGKAMNAIAHFFGLEPIDIAEIVMFGNGLEPEKTQRRQVHIHTAREWYTEFGLGAFTEEEKEKLFQFGRFLIWQRDH